MNYIMKLIAIVLVGLFSFSVSAVDIPSDDLGAQQFDKLKCIDETAQTCVNSICLNSDQIDCQDNCQKMAKEKCQQQINE